MRKLLYSLVMVVTLMAAFTFCAHAQTIRVGAFAGYTTSNDKSEAVTNDGGDFFPGFTASASFAEGKRVSFNVRGDFARPQLPTLFTTDEGKGRPEYEIRVNPEVRLNAGRFFAGVGLDAFYHGGLYVHPGEPYSRSYGVNPTASAGLRFSKVEASYTYLLKDKGTDLEGHRIDYFITPSDSFPVRFGVQYNFLTFKERNRKGYVDSYYEYDGVGKITVEIPLNKRKK